MIHRSDFIGLDIHSKDLLSYFTQRLPEIASIAKLELKTPYTIDSSDSNPDHWLNLAHLIIENWDSYEGFVILHGTDTLAYTSSALSFMLKNVTKPIILTGSQRPLRELRMDARSNMIDSIELALKGIPSGYGVF